MKDSLKKFNTYLADLAVMTFKLHNIHWNVKGERFVPIHQFTDALYEQTFEFYDAIGEHIKMNGHQPDSRLSDYLKNANIKEIAPKDFGTSESLEIVLADVKSLKHSATVLRNECDDVNWFAAVSMLEEQVEYFNKQIWFMEASLSK